MELTRQLITSKLRVTSLRVGKSPVTGELPEQMASNAENVSIWWRHDVKTWLSLRKAFVLQTIYVSDKIGNYL